MANENEINELRRNFISRYANQNYAKYQAIRERVRNCASGTATMKGIGANSQNGGGNDFTDVMKYLIPTERQKKYPAEFLRYMQMANFPGYTESTLLVALGLLGTGADTIEGAENIPESLKTFFDPVSLNRLRLNINRLQMLDGGAILMLQPMNEEKLKLGESPFEIMVYSMDKYICSQLDPDKGNIFILMDESEFVFNYRLKIPTYNNKYRLHAVDSKGRYYQAALRAEEWASFNIADPEEWDNEYAVSNPDDPQFGKAKYPVFGKTLDFIPVDFCNVTHHESDKYENPMLSSLADKDILIYNADAAYRQTLWLTSQPIAVIYGDGKDRYLPYGAGARHNLEKDWREEWLEFHGTGAAAQSKALSELHDEAQNKAMSLIAVGSNISGAALQIIQGSQVAPLVNLVNTSGQSISKMLEFALVWAGKKEIKPNYVPSEVFARLNLSAGDIMALLSMKRENPDKIPIKWAELRRRLVESGIGDEEMLAFDEFMESVKEENRILGIEEETPVPRFEHDEDL